MYGCVTATETPSALLWCLEAIFIAPFKSAFKEKPQWQTKKPSEREPICPHLEQIWAGLAAHSTFVRPWVATAHGLENTLFFPMRMARAFAYRRADHVVCVSETVRATLRASHALRLGRSSVIPPGIDLSRFTPRESRLAGDTPELLTVSRLAPEKGLEVLLEALSGILRPWRLTVVGDGPEMFALKCQAEVLGILPRVRFVGMVADPSEFYQRADLFCFPSRSEGQGISLFEAAAARVPAISSDIPAVREAFGEDAIAYAPSGDVEGWRRALERVLSRYSEALLRVDRAQEIVASRYTLDIMAKTYADLYRKLLGRSAV